MTMRCETCSKIVGFAEAVHRDAKIFHRDCFRCGSCQKKLARGAGLRDRGLYFCNNCHAKNFGPYGFKRGVSRNRNTLKRVKMNMQPPFAHIAVNAASTPSRNARKPSSASAVTATKKDITAPKRKGRPQTLHHFEVAVFVGETTQELAAYLKEGEFDANSWQPGVLESLLEEVKAGKCMVGLDTDGKPLRVATMAKVFVHDKSNDCVLVNPLNSYEDEQGSTVSLANLQRALGGQPNVSHGSEGEDVTGLKKVEIPESLIFETTFSPFNETPRDAGARLLSERFDMKNAAAKVFSKVVPKTKTNHPSVDYPGLNSEYHTYHLELVSQLVAPLQKTLPRGSMTPVKRSKQTKAGMNTNWYVWLHKSHLNATEMLNEVKAVYEGDMKVKELVGTVDFDGEMFKSLGEVLIEEFSGLNLWN